MLLKLKPALKDYLWGGNKLKKEFNFDADTDKIAEGWMLSCHKDGESIVVGGNFNGQPLSQVIHTAGRQMLGTNAEKYDFFPILIKLIDAEKDLSVQVHPNDEYALRIEGEYGKTECWYIIDCEADAELIYGFKKPISTEEFKQRIADNTFLEVVNRIKVKPGELYFIEAGTLHAIGKGILLAEIQQNSNTTYRVYDYNRLGADGKPRPLHTEKAIDVTKCEPPQYPAYNPPAHKKEGYSEKELIQCPLFSVEELEVETSATRIADQASFVSLLVIEGSGTVCCKNEALNIKKGDSIFIAAGSGEFSINGKLRIIETRI